MGNLLDFLVAGIAGTEGALAAEGPVEADKEEDAGVDDRDVVHGVGVDGLDVGERVHDEGEERPGEHDDVGNEAKLAEPEGAVLDVVAALQEEEDGGDIVGNVKKDNAGGDHRVEGGGRSNVEQAEQTDEEAGEGVRNKGNTELGVNLGPVPAAGETAITGKGPHKAGLPGVTGNLAAQSSQDNHGHENSGTGLGAESLVVELEDGNQSGSVDELAQVLHGKEHGDGVQERGGEANSQGAHDGNGDNTLRLCNLLSEMGSRVQAREGPVGVDETNNKGNATRLPSSLVRKVGENKLGVLLGRGLCEDGDGDDNEGCQGDIDEEGANLGEDLSVAVEEPGDKVEDLVGNKDLPSLNDPAYCVS